MREGATRAGAAFFAVVISKAMEAERTDVAFFVLFFFLKSFLELPLLLEAVLLSHFFFLPLCLYDAAL